MKEAAIYIHIPFCDHKCIYCDFYSIITKDNINSFLTALKKEIEYYAQSCSEERKFTSVFFGGGTPSLMEPAYITEILLTLRENFTLSGDAEITLETNPGTVNLRKLRSFNETGINRISIGIQSFDNYDLKFLTRIHDKKTAIETVFNAADAGFNNISVDLIFNLPGQTKEKWVSNLQTAAALPVKHISAYSLILERGTILNKMVLDGKVEIQDGDYDAVLYETAVDYLAEKGFHQYEVSNFSVKGFECIHNKGYWSYRDYLGFGPSAHSFSEGKRWWNYSSLKRYISEIDKNDSAVMSREMLSEEQMRNEYIMLALRSDGLDVNSLNEKFGMKWYSENYDYLIKLSEGGFLKIDNGLVRLTGKGYPVCDEILRKIL